MRAVRSLLERLGLVRSEQNPERYRHADAAVEDARKATEASRQLREHLAGGYEAAEEQRLAGKR